MVVLVTSYSVRYMSCERELKKIRRDIEFGIPGEKDITFVPFLIESSMMYSYAYKVANGEGIPEFDDRLVGMSDVTVNSQFTTGLEYLLGYSYRLKNYLFHSRKDKNQHIFEDDPEFAQWCRIQVRIWACIVSGIIFLWLVTLRIPLLYSLFGGLLHGVSAAALARYTGQDIVRGNFALPLIIATFFLAYYYLRKPHVWKLLLLFLTAFLAIATWDMTQICFAIWGVSEIIRVMMITPPQSGLKNNPQYFITKRFKIWMVIFLSMILASFLIPYHRTHILIASPMVMIVLPIILSLHIFAKGELKRRVFVLFVSLLIFVGLWYIVLSLSSFGDKYGHFGALILAKIKFFNIKPGNPDLLSFDARSIWVPGMHSANRFIMISFFPIVLHFTFFLLLSSFMIKTVRLSLMKKMALFHFPLFMFSFYGIVFFFVVRYHVFAIIFISLLLPILFDIWRRSSTILSKRDIIKFTILAIVYFSLFFLFLYNALTPKLLFISMGYVIMTILMFNTITFIVMGIKKIAIKQSFSVASYMKVSLVVIMIFILMKELDQSIDHIREYQTNYFAESAALIKWLRQENMEEDIFLADFTLSPMLKAYCNTKIVLQPKFELGETRKNYRIFTNIMFHDTERELAEFCEKQNADFFIFDKGYPNSTGPYSPRYIAAAHELKGRSPANMMSTTQTRARLRHFYKIPPPRDLKVLSNRYIVFKVISEKSRNEAESWLDDAENLLPSNPRLAAKLVKSAFFADPLSARAYLMYRKIFKKDPYLTLKGDR